jgi:hypothetical protein
LECSYNPVLDCLPHIYQSYLYYFDILGTNIHCLPNYFTAQYYETKPDTMPLCATSSCPSYNSILNISEISLHLYPNPNSGTFTLSSDRTLSGEYQVYDMMGSLIQQKAMITDRQVISLGDIPAGVYTLIVRDASNSQALRFIISH